MLSRRHFLEGAAAVLAATAAGAQTRRVLIRGGCVLSLDPAIGDFDVADVLIEGIAHRRGRPESSGRSA